jgi:hypothetical protein
VNRQELAEEMHGLGDGYDDGQVDLASEIVYKLITSVDLKIPYVNVVSELMARIDRWIDDRNFGEEEDRRWLAEHGL